MTDIRRQHLLDKFDATRAYDRPSPSRHAAAAAAAAAAQQKQIQITFGDCASGPFCLIQQSAVTELQQSDGRRVVMSTRNSAPSQACGTHRRAHSAQLRDCLVDRMATGRVVGRSTSASQWISTSPETRALVDRLSCQQGKQNRIRQAAS
ncbi:hypothetical protein IE81DRAFT_166437 [Ceraceosorus guamensis]|uniref:Uncharacterized protein n=1 Tax=Ceraceosorus guamensis TaxID=1522189 RepID=A0A316W757_9BASI|nr:hypothetical protein IE81DRAFT_166437 [Ceraceosorus guamensis]PWN45697.1 hypothetical protein IE81DRAFT_166437 [Ceraceosorus guamensis]